MDKIFPKEIKFLVKGPNVKKAFITDTPRVNPNDCYNCGGDGFFHLFLGLKGPFATSEHPYAKTTMNDKEMSLVSHFDNTVGEHGGWWVGVSYTFPCPVCKDTVLKVPAQRPGTGPLPTLSQVERLAKGMEK